MQGCQCASMRIRQWDCEGTTAVRIQGVRQNKTALNSLRLEGRHRDGNHGLSVTIKAQYAQEIRLGWSPKPCFVGKLSSWRLLEISRQPIKLCLSEKHSFSHRRPAPMLCKQARRDHKSCVIVQKNVLIGILMRYIIIFGLFCVSVSHQRVVRSRWPPHPAACQ